MFYESIQKHESPIKKYLPQYFGTVSFRGRPPLRGSKKLTHNIILENVVYGFDRPNILDLKLGKVMFSKYHSKDHQERKKERADCTTSGSHGICFAGIKYWIESSPSPRGQQDRGAYVYRDRDWGRTLDFDGVMTAFREYFAIDIGPKSSANTGRPSLDSVVTVIDRFLIEVKALKSAFTNQVSSMISSSLLIAYEGNPVSLRRKLSQGNRAKVVTVKVIDFPYADLNEGSGSDGNLLSGVETILRVLKQLRKEAKSLAEKKKAQGEGAWPKSRKEKDGRQRERMPKKHREHPMSLRAPSRTLR